MILFTPLYRRHGDTLWHKPTGFGRGAYPHIQTPPISGVTYWLTLQSFLHATAASAAQELLYQRNEIFLMKGLEDGLKTGSTIGCEPQLGTARAAPS